MKLPLPFPQQQNTPGLFCHIEMVQFLWFIPFAISSVIFTNHYNRDAVGALEKQLESDIPISVVQYALLNTIYFTPNIISPLCAGLVIKPLGGTAKVFVIFTVFAALGSMLFAIGVQSSLVSVMCAGRFISGSSTSLALH